MMKENYREQIEDVRDAYDDIVEDKHSKEMFFVDLAETKTVIDYIESDVNDILSLLEPIEGLSEIDEVKNKLSELSGKLY